MPDGQAVQASEENATDANQSSCSGFPFLKELNVKGLKKELKRLGLPTQGNKPDLMERLLQACGNTDQALSDSVQEQAEVMLEEQTSTVVDTGECKSQLRCSCNHLAKELAELRQEIRNIKEGFVIPAKSHQTEDNYSNTITRNMQMKIKQLEAERSTLIATIEILLTRKQNESAENEDRGFQDPSDSPCISNYTASNSREQVLKEKSTATADCKHTQAPAAQLQNEKVIQEDKKEE